MDSELDLMKGFGSFRDNGELLDFEIISSDSESFFVHKSYMCVWSQFFKTMLLGSTEMAECRSNVLNLKTIPSNALRSLLNFVYGETTVITIDNIDGIMNAAAFLIVDRLMNHCCSVLLKNIHPHNCWWMLPLVRLYCPYNKDVESKIQIYIETYIATRLNYGRGIPFDHATQIHQADMKRYLSTDMARRAHPLAHVDAVASWFRAKREIHDEDEGNTEKKEEEALSSIKELVTDCVDLVSLTIGELDFVRRHYVDIPVFQEAVTTVENYNRSSVCQQLKATNPHVTKMCHIEYLFAMQIGNRCWTIWVYDEYQSIWNKKVLGLPIKCKRWSSKRWKIVTVNNFLLMVNCASLRCWLFNPLNSMMETFDTLLENYCKPNETMIKDSVLVSCRDAILMIIGYATVLTLSPESKAWKTLCTLTPLAMDTPSAVANDDSGRVFLMYTSICSGQKKTIFTQLDPYSGEQKQLPDYPEMVSGCKRMFIINQNLYIGIDSIRYPYRYCLKTKVWLSNDNLFCISMYSTKNEVIVARHSQCIYSCPIKDSHCTISMCKDTEQQYLGRGIYLPPNHNKTCYMGVLAFPSKLLVQ